MASIELIPGFESFSVNEASRRKVHKAAKQGSYPAVIVVVQDGKVIHQEPVSTPDVAPATFNVMQEKYPKALLHLEDNTGKRLFSESVVTEVAKIETERYVRSHGKKPKGYGGWMFSYNRDGSDEWQIPNGMSWPDAQKWAKKKAKEDGEDYVYVMENESVTESEDTVGGLNKMANTDLERIADYADMIKDRMSQGQTLDAWMYSKISDSVKNLNSVHDTMDGNDGVDEGTLIDLRLVNESVEDEIELALTNWLNTLADGNAVAMTDLYLENGVLLGTLAKEIKQGHEQLQQYFEMFLKKSPIGSVDSFILQNFGDVCISDGTYTFEMDGESGNRESVAARYTYVWKKENKKWMIATHHSSVNP